jgi:hypothetical protein
MAGPSVVVRVLGDLAGLGNSFGDAKAKGESAAGSMRSAFSGVLGTLNQTGVLGPFGDALNTIDTSIGQISKHSKDIGQGLMIGGAALAGIGTALTAIGSKDQAAHQQLQASVEATGKSYSDYAGRVDEAIKHQEKFGDTSHETQDALRVLTQATGDPAKALGYLSTATDLAAAKHITLEEAATKIGKAYNGNTRILKEYGVEVQKTTDAHKAAENATTKAEAADKSLADAKQRLADLEEVDASKKKLTTAEAITLRNAQEKVMVATQNATQAHERASQAQAAAKDATNKNADAIDKLSGKLHGQATAAADTFGGHMAELKAKVEDTAASLGQKYGPALTGAGAAMSLLGGGIKGAQAAMSLFTKSTELATDATEAQEGAQAGLNVVMDANPIMLVVLAIAAIVAALVLAYNHVTWFRAAVDAMGRFVVRTFQDIKQWALDAFDWLKDHWPLILAILAGPFGLAIYEIASHWESIMTFLRGLPAKVEGVVGHMWDGIANAFKSVLNWVIDLWNKLHFTTPSFDIFGQHIGGVTIGVPPIPHLAQGGLITNDGIVYAHAGEVISPAPRGAGGPAVKIEHAHFHDELDIDAAMRHMAWSVRTAQL